MRNFIFIFLFSCSIKNFQIKKLDKNLYTLGYFDFGHDIFNGDSVKIRTPEISFEDTSLLKNTKYTKLQSKFLILLFFNKKKYKGKLDFGIDRLNFDYKEYYNKRFKRYLSKSGFKFDSSSNIQIKIKVNKVKTSSIYYVNNFSAYLFLAGVVSRYNSILDLNSSINFDLTVLKNNKVIYKENLNYGERIPELSIPKNWNKSPGLYQQYISFLYLDEALNESFYNIIDILYNQVETN